MLLRMLTFFCRVIKSLGSSWASHWGWCVMNQYTMGVTRGMYLGIRRLFLEEVRSNRAWRLGSSVMSDGVPLHLPIAANAGVYVSCLITKQLQGVLFLNLVICLGFVCMSRELLCTVAAINKCSLPDMPSVLAERPVCANLKFLCLNLAGLLVDVVDLHRSRAKPQAFM
jgi:hypothetical protein